jgi:hypothetical protein
MRFGKLLTIIGKSEAVHYRRIGKLFKNIKSWSGRLIAWPVIAFLVTIFHYMFSFMHTLFELSLMVFMPAQFDNNMKELELKYKK